MPPGDKSDPLGQAGPQRKAVLWIDREGMEEARENYWRAFAAHSLPPLPEGTDYVHPRYVWDISFAAAVAAIDFVMAGRVTP